MQPDRIRIGASVTLLSVTGVAEDWGVTEKAIRTLLATLKLPLIKLPGGDKRYVSLFPLEQGLFELGMPEAFKGDRAYLRTLQELAGVLYGTLTREVIRERVKAMAKTLRDGRLTDRKKGPIMVRKRS